MSGSDDGFSTDAESLWSYDSGSTPAAAAGYLIHQDAVSVGSSDYDSAICSPKSLTLDRDSHEQLTVEHITLEDENLQSDASLLESQASTDTILYDSGSDTDDEEVTRERSSTVKAV